jgi:HAMP domain-containing protein
MDRIISDALDSSSSLLRVAIFDARGELITSTGSLDLPLEMDVEVFSEPEAVLFGGTHVLSDGRVVVLFHTAMTLAGETIGALEATLDTEDIRTVTTDYTGLGRSGETQLFMSYQDELLMLSPLRHDPELQRVPARRSAHLVQILAGEEPVQRSRIVDYRGTEVWAATRLLEQVGWGLVVKIDLAEEAQRALRLRDEMLDVGLALSAIAILGGILLGFHLGRPLRELNEVVKRVRAGEDELRANVGSRDEVGFLGEALNELLDERQDRL